MTFLIAVFLPGQTLAPAAESMLEQGIIELEAAYNGWDINRFETGQGFFTQARDIAPDHYLPYYWLGVSHFFMTIYYRYAWPEDQNDKKALDHIEAGLIVLKQAIQKHADGESYALLATLIGMKIDLKPLTAIWLGPQVMTYKDKAQQLGPNNPRACYLLGVSYYYGPGFLGGKEKGLEHLLKAEELFKYESDQPYSTPALLPRWGRSTCLVFIARLYSQTGRLEQARSYYQKALIVNPNDLLARKELTRLIQKN
ncbi:tetratricopeptide repeat protein [bacterium]|nr:tetratricopeptide repeat protein [bacterium]